MFCVFGGGGVYSQCILMSLELLRCTTDPTGGRGCVRISSRAVMATKAARAAMLVTAMSVPRLPGL